MNEHYEVGDKIIVSNYKYYGKSNREVRINWSALGDVDISTTMEFLKDLNKAVALAKKLEADNSKNEQEVIVQKPL